jgi:chromosome segregation protein
LTIDNSSGTLPIEFSEVTITRALFRSGDSDYAINGVSCRLLDIQELLSDSGVGRQQHVIISQGQIDAVLNARPEDRRLIIEEAAGVLKYRKRKEKAERRLLATEANLTRIQDMLREIRRQLKPLERQADAARRHADVVGELAALRIHLAGREIARLRSQLQDSVAAQADHRQADRRLRSELAQLDAEVLEVEARLSGVGGPDVSDVLVRYESFRERARGLAALVAERRRGVDRDREAFVDQAVVASLEAERVQCTRQLEELDVEERERHAEVAEVEQAERELAEARRQVESTWATPGGADETAAEAPVEAATVRAELAAARTAAGRSASDVERLDSQRTVLAGRVERRRAEVATLDAEIETRRAASDDLAASAAAAAERLEVAAAERDDAERDHEAAAAEDHRWTARADALRLALDEARQRAGAERLAGISGVLGTLLDAIEIDPGWEPAVEAVAADVLGAVVVESHESAVEALAALAAADLSGAVLPLAGSGRGPADPPPVGEPVRRHVRGLRPGADAALDRIFAGAVRVDGDWRAALDVALDHPAATVVTATGDRFSPRGWALGAAGAGATGAALDEAVARAEQAATAVAAAAERVRVARAVVVDAEAASTAGARAVEENRRDLAAAEERRERALAVCREIDDEVAGLDAHRAELEARAAAERDRVDALAASLPALESAEAERAERARGEAEARRAVEQQARSVAELRTQVEVRAAALVERRESLVARIAHLEERLTRHQDDRLIAERRHRELDARADVLDRLGRSAGTCLASIEAVLDVLRAARREQSERTRAITGRLEELRRERAAREKQLDEVRERLQRAEIADTETKLRLEAATESVRHELDSEPETALAAPCPPLPEGTSAPARVRELERDIRLMGPINPLALEEFSALQERHTFFEGQLDDIRQTRRELSKVIRAVDEEIVSVFSSAYADVSENFARLFDTLFPGGQGALRLTEPHDLLSTGIEIEAKPSGKNVKKLSLLSGGERSLTALAYLFAVFRSRPSPFYVMDEVEAALDDVNLHRFLGLVAEFRDAAQLIIVSHQKRTMEAADVLYGVTMEPGGSSKVISERVGALLD